MPIAPGGAGISVEFGCWGRAEARRALLPNNLPLWASVPSSLKRKVKRSEKLLSRPGVPRNQGRVLSSKQAGTPSPGWSKPQAQRRGPTGLGGVEAAVVTPPTGQDAQTRGDRVHAKFAAGPRQKPRSPDRARGDLTSFRVDGASFFGICSLTLLLGEPHLASDCGGNPRAVSSRNSMP